MLHLLSPSSDYIAENFSILFFPKSEFTTKRDVDYKRKKPDKDCTYMMVFFLSIFINLSILYYAMKFACIEGFEVRHFLCAYFFSLPYLLLKLFTRSKKS